MLFHVGQSIHQLLVALHHTLYTNLAISGFSSLSGNYMYEVKGCKDLILLKGDCKYYPEWVYPVFQLSLKRKRILLQVAEYCPQQSLEWLSTQVMRNKLAHAWTLQNMEVWVEAFLMSHNNPRVRNAAAFLLVALVPSNHFRQVMYETFSSGVFFNSLTTAFNTKMQLCYTG